MPDLLFYPWARTPLGAAVVPSPDGAARIKPAVVLRGPGGELSAGPTEGPAMLGPEGVTGVDPAAIVRMEPPPGSTDAEPNYLACVEFAAVELPWLFTPERVADDRLRPWFVLVVTETERGVLVPGLPLPLLEVDTAQLPDLRDSWGWAHVQAVPAAPGDRGISRLLCPRALAPATRYRACVVPAYRGGVAAGIGADPGPDRYEPAWGIEPVKTIRLPVYHAWEFATGEEGDFEALVERLRPVSAEEYGRLGSRLVDVTVPWPAGRPLDGGPVDGAAITVAVSGALTGIGDRPHGSADQRTMRDFATRLAPQLNAPADRIAGTLDRDDTTGAVAPPIYGGRAVRRDRVPAAHPDWVEELNLDPAHRIAAAVGADWVRRNQEFLMARAWEQVGAVRDANRRRRAAELTAAVAGAVHGRHVARLTAGEILAVAAPAAARTRAAPEVTVRAEITVSVLPDAVASPAFARLVRPGGPVARAAAAGGGEPPRMDTVVRRGLVGEVLLPDPPPLAERVDRTPGPPEAYADELAEGARAALAAGDAARAAERLAVLTVVPPAARAAGLNDTATAVEEALAGVSVSGDALRAFDLAALRGELLSRLDDAAGVTAAVTDMLPAAPRADAREVTALGVQVDAGRLRARLAGALSPAGQVARRLADRVHVPAPLDPGGLEPIMVHPEFPAPVGLALRAEDPEWFLPGVGALPPDRAALLRTNGRFVAAFMVGLNDEMNRELRWREYPTDLRGSPFTRFWPRPGGHPDLAPVHTWTDGGGLTGRAASDVDMTVLLVRGDLVRRHPDLIVAAAPARAAEPGPWPPNLDPAGWTAPTFTITIDWVTAAYAFAIPPEEFLDPPPDRPLWYFVFSEHGRRLRFGFDVARFDGPGAARPYATWDDLSWANVVDGRGFAVAGAWPRPNPGPTAPGADDRWWNSDAAQIARIALQAPFRVLIHPHRLLGRGS